MQLEQHKMQYPTLDVQHLLHNQLLQQHQRQQGNQAHQQHNQLCRLLQVLHQQHENQRINIEL
jgi:hypothetical protein